MDNIKRDPEYRNYAKIAAALKFIEQVLKRYTEHKLREIHRDIYKTMAGQPACRQNCSEIFPKQTHSWCISCKGWRNLLTQSSRTHISLENVHSSDWPLDHLNIVEFFIPASFRGVHKCQDLSTACYIWSNMTACKIKPALINRIRRERNSFAHNSFHTATSREMSRAFDTFRDLLKDPDVTQYIDTRDSLNGLADIEKGVGEDKQLLNIELNVQQLNAKVNAQGLAIEQCLQTVENIERRQFGGLQENMRQQTPERRQDDRNNSAFKQICRRIWNNVVVRYTNKSAYGLLLAIFFITYIKNTQDLKQGCLSEQYYFPAHQDLPLLPYLSDHSSLVGREWLFEELHTSLVSKSNDTNTQGVILVAEMGYGKSAIVSELICPTSNKNNVKDIRKHTVGFHVCKFDVRATHSVGRFILRLAGFLVTKSAEFGSILSMLPEYLLLHDMDRCEKDPIACFDQAILHPIKQLKDIPDKPWIFIIDALDECATTVKDDVLNLLISRIKLLPSWVKMIITARNETYLSYFRRMQIQYLKTDDVRNKNDLKTFIDTKLPVSPTKSRLIEDLIEKSDGNFVYVVQAVKWLVTFKNTSAIPELPSDIAHIYEMNFDRVFKTAEDYTIPRMILEIICSTINPVSKDDIYTILTENNVSMNRAEFNGYFHTLSFFLNTNTGVRVKHQALFAWLTSKVNINFQILLERGHSYMSRYLFKNMKSNKRVNLVDLAIHVGNSNDTQLQKIFVTSKMINETLINKENVLHKIIWQTKSVKPLELILSQIDFVDGLNEGNVTAVFVAAAKGNLEQLKRLQRKGANMNFLTYSDFLISAENISDTLDKMKNVYYSGYSLLHIAALHGHLNVVEYLLQYNQSMLHIKNSLGMHAGHIACEKGHLDVIKIMYEVNSSLFDFECLYYSSKNDHLDIVEWLVLIGVKYMCISDSKSSDALVDIISKSTLSQTLKIPDVFTNVDSNVYIKTLDIWWIVFKTDPLLAAIRNGSITTAVLISKIFPLSKNCSDAFGFTPALASIVYNRTELFPVLLDQILTDTCHKIPFHILSTNLPYVRQMLSSNDCPENGGLAHLLALYPSLYQLKYFFENHFHTVQWNMPDKVDNYPLHYAISNNNMYFVLIYKKQFKWFDDLRTRNGSSAYHIASICGLPLQLHFLSNDKEFVPQLKDNNDQGILHYIVQRPLNALIAKGDKESSEGSQYMFIKLVNESAHDLMTVDTFRRNILHYALLFGHFDIIRYIIQEQNSDFKQLLRQKDINGYQPFQFAIKKRQQLNYVMVLKTSSCPYYQSFFSECTNSVEQFGEFMSPWEMSLLHIILNMTHSDFKLLIQPHLSEVWTKSAHLITAIMTIHNYRDKIALRKLIVGSNHTGVTRYNQLTILHYLPSVYIVCGKHLKKSPLHYTMLNFDKGNTVLSFSEDDQRYVLKQLLRESVNIDTLSCKDRNGLNIFHYALLGGKIAFARLFMENGITTVDDKTSIKDVLIMALQSRLSNALFSSSVFSNALKNKIDDLLVDLIKLHINHIGPGDICTNNSVDLSLIHLLAQNGMLKTIQLLVQMFSPSIFHCRNIDGFTPLYFGKLFGHIDLVNMFENDTLLVGPDRSAEQLLLVFLVAGFPETESSTDINPFAFTSVSSSFVKRRKWYHCMRSITEQLYFNTETSFTRKRVIILHDLDPIENIQFHQNVLLKDIMNVSSKLTEIPNEILFVFESLNDMLIQISVRSSHSKNRKSHFMYVLKNAFSFLERYTIPKYVNKHTVEMSRVTYVAYRKIIKTMRQILQNAATQYYLQGKLSLARTISDNYSFLAKRLQQHGFNISRQITDPVVSFDQKIINNFHHYRYLYALRPTLSYKMLSKDILRDTRMFSYYSQKSVSEKLSQAMDSFKQTIHIETLKEPFIDLQEKK